jgi:hypothetical protein
VSEHEKTMLRDLVRRALADAGSVPPAARADLYHAAALALAPADPALAHEAMGTAQALRDAEARQIVMAELLGH